MVEQHEVEIVILQIMQHRQQRAINNDIVLEHDRTFMTVFEKSRIDCLVRKRARKLPIGQAASRAAIRRHPVDLWLVLGG